MITHKDKFISMCLIILLKTSKWVFYFYIKLFYMHSFTLYSYNFEPMQYYLNTTFGW